MDVLGRHKKYYNLIYTPRTTYIGAMHANKSKLSYCNAAGLLALLLVSSLASLPLTVLFTVNIRFGKSSIYNPTVQVCLPLTVLFTVNIRFGKSSIYNPTVQVCLPLTVLFTVNIRFGKSSIYNPTVQVCLPLTVLSPSTFALVKAQYIIQPYK